MTQVSFQGFCEVNTTDRIKRGCKNQPKIPSTTRNFFVVSDFLESRSESGIYPGSWLPLSGLLQWILTKKFFLYVRGCCFAVKEGWLLPLTYFKWLKGHSKRTQINPQKYKEYGYSSTTFPAVELVQQVIQRIPTILPKTTTTNLLVPISGQSLVTE